MRVPNTSHKWIGGLAIILVLLVWQISATRIRMPLILPTPGEALIQIATLIVTNNFWHHLGATLSRGLIGFGLSLLAGLVIGLFAGRNTWIAAFFRPLIILMRSTPVMSVIILALIWFKRDTVPIFVTFLMAFPIVVQNIIEGVQGIEKDLLEMVTTYRVCNRQRFTKLYLPSLAPFLAAGISAGLGITWKVLIAAEVLAYPTWGIGAQMDTARVYLQTDKVFAWTLVVVSLGLVFDYLLDFLLKKPFQAWKEACHD
jgi:NitT/TauT family transport system permease protein